jgi:ABC-2 type transport system permease protein
MLTQILNRFISSSFQALVVKETRQLLRNKGLLVLLTVVSMLQILLYGLTLNPDVTHIKLGVVDYAKVYESRELVSALTENQVFVLKQDLSSQKLLAQKVQQGNVTVGLVIPPEFKRKLSQEKPANLQVLVDGVDANTAGIASSYILGIIHQFGRQLLSDPVLPLVRPLQTFLYNPGLISSWFFVPGVIGMVLTVNSSLVSALVVIREKEIGTLEQLLMTPAAIWEILLAKLIPLFVVLIADLFLALGVGRLVFGVPMRGSLLLLTLLSGLYLLVGIGMGMMLATLCRNQQQVVLLVFFSNVPLIQLSGSIAPVESMPTFLRYLSVLDPLRHYIQILQGILLKGVGFNVLWLNVLALAVFAVVFLTIGINRFRGQLT